MPPQQTVFSLCFVWRSIIVHTWKVEKALPRVWGKRCRECGGSAFCVHSIRKSNCKLCEGGSFCCHGKMRYRCQECGGSQICEHNKRKEICRACNGSAFCPHGIQKHHCRPCSGSSLCSHGKIRSVCKQCGGASICIHGKHKSMCLDCDGSSFCEHGKRRSRCSTCGGSDLCRNRASACPTWPNPKYDNYCSFCFGNLFPNDPRTAAIRTKSKEVLWVNALLQLEVTASCIWKWDEPLYVTYDGGCCNSKRRIDLWTLVGNVVVAIEIDEDQHRFYKPDYEANRYQDLVMSFTGRFVFLRINPDPYKSSGSKIDPPFPERLEWAEKTLTEILQTVDNESEDLVVVHHLFYDE